MLPTVRRGQVESSNASLGLQTPKLKPFFLSPNSRIKLAPRVLLLPILCRMQRLPNALLGLAP
jgi:hypothetical protein